MNARDKRGRGWPSSTEGDARPPLTPTCPQRAVNFPFVRVAACPCLRPRSPAYRRAPTVPQATAASLGSRKPPRAGAPPRSAAGGGRGRRPTRRPSVKRTTARGSAPTPARNVPARERASTPAAHAAATWQAPRIVKPRRNRGSAAPGSGGGFVRAVRLVRDEVPSFEVYPFSIPAIRALDELALNP